MTRYHECGEDAAVTVTNDFSAPEEIRPSVFFRTEEDFEDWELIALERCGQRVLDIGAGVGSHALVLQARGHSVTALELLPGAVRIMRDRGIEDVRLGRVEELLEIDLAFDTILLLMNGSMLAGTLVGLEHLLASTSSMLSETGVIMMDSTDLGLGGDSWDRTNQDYPGELQYQLKYADLVGKVFPQLFVDPEVLRMVSRNVGLQLDIIWQDDSGHYLAELKRG
ncbi:MAG: hypothetical protein CME30_00365 [Gemmatimonadetes bacterium]|nr:hypothetical protein [Gemmatimonadota bacterium]